MRLDYELMNEILTSFLDSEQSTLNIDSFLELYEKDAQKLAHHLIIMEEKGLVIGAFPNGNMGIELECEGLYDFAYGTPWRLTSNGYDFAAALTKTDILTTIKKIAKKKATKLLDE